MKRICSRLFSVTLFLIVLGSCNYRDDYNNQPELVEGYAPVYFDSVIFINSITSVAPKTLTVVGGIFIYKNYLMVVEENAGIHVFDRSDTLAPPLAVCFINFPYVHSLSVKADILYVQNSFGLVYLDIANLPLVQVLGMISSNASNVNAYPPTASNTGIWFDNRAYVTYFECPDPAKGRIVRWDKKQLNKPKCNIRN
jgi:hypothetical protein